jgi:hypothetical protein
VVPLDAGVPAAACRLWQTARIMPRPAPLFPLIRQLLAGLPLICVLDAASPAAAATDLLAFTRGTAQRQGTFDAGGVAWTCGGELCSAKGPDDQGLWPGVCAAFVREAGAVAAFGTVKNRFDAAGLSTCNQAAGAAPATPPVAISVPAEPTAPAAPAAPAAPRAPAPVAASPAPAAIPAVDAGTETCNGRDDDGDGAVDEGVRIRVWEDRDHDLYGDPGRSREICPQELAPGLVVNDYDCDDADGKRNPARDNCG